MRLVLLALTALLAHGAAAAAPPVLRLTGPVKELAADGGRVAVLVQTSRPRCTQSRVAVWQPSTRSLAPIGVSPCSESVSTGAAISEVALAGRRVAYLEYAGGNTRELQLKSATLPVRRPVVVASASFDLDEISGTFLGRLAGDGGLLAFDWWQACPSCGGRGIPDSSSVWRLSTAGVPCPTAGLGTRPFCDIVRAGPLGERLLAVGGGLLAIRTAEGLAIVTGENALRASIPIAAGVFRAARLDGDGRTLAVLTATGVRNELRAYDTAGRATATYRLPAAPTSGAASCGDPSGCSMPALRLEDIQSGIAVLVSGRDVRLVRLSDGKVALIRAPGRTPVHAQLEPDGLYYSYSLTARSSRVAFLPFSGLAARFR